MAMRIWKTELGLSLFFTGLAWSGFVGVSSLDSAICPAASPVDSILQLEDLCSVSDIIHGDSSSGDWVGVTEVFRLLLFSPIISRVSLLFLV